jgi:type IV pilus assembly protein PilF
MNAVAKNQAMKMSFRSSTVVRLELLFPFAALVLGSVILCGCASKSATTGVTAGRGEVITESDESSERKRARIRIELALGYFEQGKTSIALDEIKQAILADPGFSDAYSLRGLIYMRLNDFAFAEESFKKALSIKLDPNVLHNLGWLKCQQEIYPEALKFFAQALANPLYGERAKTFMAQGLCQSKAAMYEEAESSLLKSYEYDAGNPVTGYNLAGLLFRKADFVRAQFYIRRLNNSELANAESLWLGIKVERRLNNQGAMLQLGTQLEKRYPQSNEMALYRRGAFDE